MSGAGGLATAFRVLRAEGPAAFRDRLLDRLAEARRAARYRPLPPAAARFESRVLNLLAMPPAPRFGGVPALLLARLREEEKERPTALLYPAGHGYRLELSQGRLRRRLDSPGAPLAPTRLVDAAFEEAVLAAAGRVGAQVLHVEGVAGLPLESLLRLRGRGLELVLSLHDFGLFCARPHLLERPADRFCGYCADLERCRRCLEVDFDVGQDEQARRRARGRELLAAAAAVVYPSAFLRARHHELFGPLDEGRQHVVPPAAGPASVPVPRAARGPGTHVAYVGAVHPHKGGHVFEEVVRRLADTPGLRFSVLGGGDPTLLGRLARLPRVQVRGYYRAGALPRLLRATRVDLALLLSVWPESYGMTLDECRAAGVPVLAFDHGAIAERVRRDGGGRLVALDGGAVAVAAALAEGPASFPALAPGTDLPTPAGAARAMRALYAPILAGPAA